jgi:hypothetical protein
MENKKLNQTHSAYPDTLAEIRQKWKNIKINVQSFKQALSPCYPSKCYGMCCYDGVYLEPEEVTVIKNIVVTESHFFKRIGLELPEKVVVYNKWENIAGEKTTTKPKNFSTLLANYPTHFEDTACIFLLDDGRCALQMLSESKNFHPWYYKPITCWLHPINVIFEDTERYLIIHNEEDEPSCTPDYDGYVSKTLCGKICKEGGQPAYEILKNELHFLGTILDRDLISEISSNLVSE